MEVRVVRCEMKQKETTASLSWKERRQWGEEEV